MNLAILPASEERKRRLHDKLRRELGSEIRLFLDDPSVAEILLNEDGQIWVEKLGCPMEKAGYLSPSVAESAMMTIASLLNQVITHEHPVVEGELSLDGSRFEGLIPPLVSAPVFAIRKRASQVFTLDDYVQRQIMTQAQCEAIKHAVFEKSNILVVGGTGTGKTTFINALIRQITDICDDRIIILEDTPEIQCVAENKVFLRSSAHFDLAALLRMTLRLRPDRIMVGECRGGEALALLKAWNTGHPGGAATLHANNARAGLVRLENLIAEATSAPMKALIAESVHLIVAIKRTPTGRFIEEVCAVKGLDSAGDYKICQL